MTPSQTVRHFSRTLIGQLRSGSKETEKWSLASVGNHSDPRLGQRRKSSNNYSRSIYCHSRHSPCTHNYVSYCSNSLPSISKDKKIFLSDNDLHSLPLLSQVRWKHRAFNNRNNRVDDEDEDDDDEDEEEESDDDEEPVDLSLAPNEKNLGNDSKTVIKQFPAPLAQFVTAYVLGLSNDDFLEVFYQGRVSLNGSLLARKKRKLRRGDRVDIVESHDEAKGEKTVIRFVVMEIEPLPGNKVKVEMEVYKPGIRISD